MRAAPGLLNLEAEILVSRHLQDRRAGTHLVMNSLAVLGCASLVGADLARAAIALDSRRRGRPRHADNAGTVAAGARHRRSYNANPTSMRARSRPLGPGAARAGWSAHPR